jgi:hypothetical protein
MANPAQNDQNPVSQYFEFATPEMRTVFERMD